MKNKVIKKVIFILIFILFLFSSTVIAKFFSKEIINVEGKVVEPIMEIQENKTINITAIENKIYDFKIKNFKDEKISSMTIEYYIEILSIQNENIKYKMYKEEKEIKITKNKTDKFILEKNIKQENNWRLEILLNDNSDQEISQEIRIKVHYEQKNI